MNDADMLHSIATLRLDVRVRKAGPKLTVAGPEHVFELEGTALDIWVQINGRRSVRDIGESIAQEYDISADEAIADVAELLKVLADHDLLLLQSPRTER